MPPPPSSSTERTKTHTQKKGAYAALGLGLAFVALIVYFVVFGGRPQVQKSVETSNEPKTRDVAVPGGPEGGILYGEELKIDLVDKKDPNRRQTGQIILTSLDPLEARRYAADKPRAWLYLSDGRSVYIRADSGKLYMPDQRQAPESGTISGNVEIKMFAAKPDGQRVDLAVDKPTLTLLTETLAFEAALGEVGMPGRVTVLAEGVEFKGTDISLVFNQPKERLEHGNIRKGGFVRVVDGGTKKQSKPTEKPAGETATVATAPGAGATAAAPAAARIPVETLYRMIMTEKVTLTQMRRQLDAEKLEVVARLLDNQLPAGAITEVKFASRGEDKAAATPAASSPPAGGGTTPAPTDAAATVAQESAPSKDMVLAWTGPCTIVPLADTPVELKNNHVALRFTADKAVKLADGERGITGTAAAIAYGATEGALSLIGGAGSAVAMNVPGSGLLNAARIDADLMKGIVRTPGAGSLTSGTGDSDRQQIAWSESGEFAFYVKDGQLTNTLKNASVSGTVSGSGKGLSFKSDQAKAEFADARQLEVTRTILKGNAVADSADTGHMEGGLIDVVFDPPVNETGPRARMVTAEDHVVVQRTGQRLASSFLNAKLIDVEGGKSDVGWVLARGNVKFASEKDFVSGSSDELSADLGFDENGKRKQLVSLIGPGATITKDQPGQDQGTITGTQMQIDGQRGRLEAFGDGSFDYKGFAKGAPSSIDAKWTKRMVYDDLAGLIDCLGDSSIHYSPDRLTRNKADGEHVKLMITPGTPGRSLLASLPGQADGGQSAPPRVVEVLSAEAHGSVLDREDGVNARIESRGYSADDAAQQTLEKLYYLEGPTILADNVAGTMDVPGAGKFLLMDQSVAPAALSTAPGTRDLGGDARGVSLFDWAGSLHVERHPEGNTTMLMKDGVSVVHRALKDGTVTEIKCATMAAELREQGGSLSSPSRGKTELHHVEALGGVYSASGPPKTEQQPKPPIRELIAQKLNYDAIRQRIVAESGKDGIVTMFDPAMASPQTASWLSWDLATGSVELKNPAGAVPR